MIGDNTPWPWDEIEKLIKLWADGDSASVIGGMMRPPKSRSAILGKVHRLGLAKRRTGRALPRKKPVRGSRPPRKAFHFGSGSSKPQKVEPPKIIPVTEIVPLNGEGITILDLHKEVCHAVVKEFQRGSDELPRYCGHPAMEGFAYCASHYSAFHQPLRARG